MASQDQARFGTSDYQLLVGSLCESASNDIKRQVKDLFFIMECAAETGQLDVDLLPWRKLISDLNFAAEAVQRVDCFKHTAFDTLHLIESIDNTKNLDSALSLNIQSLAVNAKGHQRPSFARELHERLWVNSLV